MKGKMLILLKMIFGFMFSLGVIIFTIINLKKNSLYINILSIVIGILLTIIFLGQVISRIG